LRNNINRAITDKIPGITEGKKVSIPISPHAMQTPHNFFLRHKIPPKIGKIAIIIPMILQIVKIFFISTSVIFGSICCNWLISITCSKKLMSTLKKETHENIENNPAIINKMPAIEMIVFLP